MLSVLTAQAPSPCSAAQHIRAHNSLCSFSLRIRISFFHYYFLQLWVSVLLLFAHRFVLFVFFSFSLCFPLASTLALLYNKSALRSAANHNINSFFFSFLSVLVREILANATMSFFQIFLKISKLAAVACGKVLYRLESFYYIFPKSCESQHRIYLFLSLDIWLSLCASDTR